MSDEEQQAEPEPETSESVPPLEDHHEEAMKEMTLEERQEALTRSRWNVFLYLGLAALMFGFALFPFPFSADLNTGGKTYEQDLGFVWGLPLDGEDFTDVPISVEIVASNPSPDPTSNGQVDIAVYLINSNDCGLDGWGLKEDLREGNIEPDHKTQFQTTKDGVKPGDVFEFEFDVDGGNVCLFAEYIDAGNGNAILSRGEMDIDGDMWPNQIYAGILAVLFLGLSGFAFIGAQRHGEGVKALTEPSKKSTEDEVLETAGPSGPPPSSAGPSGPPSAGPSGPPQAAEPEPVAEEAPTEPVFEPAENGYFFRKMPDGSYDQTVYVQAEDGSYVPYQE